MTRSRWLPRSLPLLLLISLAHAQTTAPSAAPQAPATTAPSATPPTAAAPAPTSTNPQDWQQIYRVSKIIGTDVRNLQGDKIGDIKDIVVNRGGTITYAIVATGGFLGIGNRLHAVPWGALQSSPGRNYRVLDIDKERLKKAPNFDPENWPNVVDERWSNDNRRFYGTGQPSGR